MGNLPDLAAGGKRKSPPLAAGPGRGGRIRVSAWAVRNSGSAGLVALPGVALDGLARWPLIRAGDWHSLPVASVGIFARLPPPRPGPAASGGDFRLPPAAKSGRLPMSVLAEGDSADTFP
jgi:hypothetical protein